MPNDTKSNNQGSNLLVLKADDVMPWGPCVGMTLREVYKNNNSYYTDYLLDADKYKISNATKRILERDLPDKEQSDIPSSCAKSTQSNELKCDTVLNIGPFKGKKLLDVARKNITYFRYLLQAGYFYISKETISDISKALKLSPVPKPIDNVTKNGQEREENKKSKKTRTQIDKLIDDCIRKNGTGINPEKDLQNYIGDIVPTTLSEDCLKKIDECKLDNRYNLHSELKRIYGKNAKFHEGQEEAILSVLTGHRTLVVQRTGWGKSLVYFLAIKILRQHGKGPAVIISPLIALMRDQVSKLTGLGLAGTEITSENQKKWPEIYKNIADNKYDVIFIAPEKLDNTKFMNQLDGWISSISLFVIDEAHCISDWGHDFRPDFRRISKLVNNLSVDTCVLATTATANDRVKRDIKYQLGNTSDLEIETGRLLRENFRIDVMNLPSKQDKTNWLKRNLPKLLANGKGIIYCQTVNDTLYLAEELNQLGFNALPYNARIDPEIKIKTIDSFTNGDTDILVATVAFGMGVDIPDISFIIHYQQVKGIIEYYQQIGRGGRDEKKSQKYVCHYAPW